MRHVGHGRHRYLILLLVLVAAIVFGTGQRLFPLLREAAVTVMMVVIFLVVFDRPAYRYVSLGAGIIGLLTMWWAVVAPDGPRHEGQIVVHLAGVMFFGTAVAMVLRHLFERRAVDLDDILGTLCGYLLSALAWSNLYSLIEVVSPGAFQLAVPDQPALTRWYERDSLFLYFSLTTLTTIGYGDITPVAPAARSAAVLQGVFGQFYVAVVVAQLVGSKLAEARTRNGDR